MNDPVLVRRKLREVLAMAPTRWFTVPMLLDAVGRLLPHDLKLDELNAAIQWNHATAQDYIEYRFDKDIDDNVWRLTDEGKQKQGL